MAANSPRVTVAIPLYRSKRFVERRIFRRTDFRTRRRRGSAFGGVKGRSQLPDYVERYMRGEIKIDEMVTYTMPLDDINRAFDLMHEGKAIRSVILF